MKRISMVVLFALLAAVRAQADEKEGAISRLLEEKANSQVLVQFDLKRSDGRGARAITLQGTVVSAEGLVLVTGANQVDPPLGGNDLKPDGIKIRLPGDRKLDAVFVGKDEELNLAVLRIREPEGSPYPAATFAHLEVMRPAQPLMFLKRMGHGDDDLPTFGLTRVTAVIPRSGLPAEVRITGSFNSFFGCPIYSIQGSLVGYVASGTGSRGGSFRVVGGRLQRVGGGGSPARILDAKTVFEFLADPTRFERRDCWLGVSGLQALTKDLADALGLEKPGGIVIGNVSEKSPAERAGLQSGDVLLAMDDEPLETKKDRDVASFSREVRRARAGETHKIALLRRGDDGYVARTLEIAFEEEPLTEGEVEDYNDEAFGLKVKPLTRDFLERVRLPLDTKGVRVSFVEPAGWAFLAGIQTGDVIAKMVMRPCENLKQYKEITAALLVTRDSEVCYNVSRQRRSLFLCVRPDWDTVEAPKSK